MTYLDEQILPRDVDTFIGPAAPELLLETSARLPYQLGKPRGRARLPLP